MTPDRPQSAADGAAIAAARTIVFAGGGTGGHLSPGLAIAEALAVQSPGVRRLFVCSNRPIDARMLTDAGERFITTEAAPFGASLSAVRRFVRGWRATVRAMRELNEHEQPAAVIALGGFVAAPVSLALKRCGVPLVLLNLDAVPGKANRLIARKADVIVSTCATPGFSRFEGRRVAMPLRRSTLAATFGDHRACRLALGLDADTPVLLVTGASQGAKSLNDLMEAAAQDRPEILRGWQVHHISGEGRGDSLASAYSRAGVRALVESFQPRMGLAWGAAEFAVSRAGANSVAEIVANGVPALFLPYPHHRDQHQAENAKPLVDLGGAMCETDQDDPRRNLESLGDLLDSVLHDPECRREMRAALAGSPASNGASEVARIVLEAAGLSSDPHRTRADAPPR